MKDLKTRVISGIQGIILLCFIVFRGGLLLKGSLFIISLIGLFEYFRALENVEIHGAKYLIIISTIFLYILGMDYFNTILIFSLMIGMLLLLTKKYTIEDIGVSLLSFIYIPTFFYHIYLLDGSKYIWLIFIIAFGTDTFAYFAGNFFGKNKLCPSISPNKTIEGFIGGIFGSVVLTMIYGKVFIELNNVLILVPLSIIGGIISQCGDLVASSVKRYAEIKDYGNLIPGHGGIMDRFDSIIFTTPVIYYYLMFFIN